MSDNKNLNQTTEEQYRIYRQMINSFYEEEQKEQEIQLNNIGTVKIEPKLINDQYSNNLKVEFKIGNTHMYKIKSLPEFYTNMLNKEKFSYGKKLEFVHTRRAFEEESEGLLNFVLKYAEIIKYAKDNMNYYSSTLNENCITLTDSGIDDFFEVMKNKKIEYRDRYEEGHIEFLDTEPKIEFKVEEKNEEDFILTTDFDTYDYTIFYGRKFIYFLMQNKLYRCSKKFEKTTLKLLNTFRVNFTKEIPFKKEEFSEIYSLIIPEIKERFILNELNKEDMEKYIPKDLKVKVFLDLDKAQNIIADVKFCYDEVEFNPLISEVNDIPRNIIEESKSLDLFKNAGFMFNVKKYNLILADQDHIYDFLKGGIEEFLKRFEVLATDSFKNNQIIVPKMSSIGVKIENNLLNIDLSGLDFDRSEIEEILKKYSLKKKYHRLKNGQFIDLEDNSTLDVLEKISESSNIDFKDLNTSVIKVPIYRGLYLEKILKQNDIVVKQSEEYKDLISDVYNKDISDKYELPVGLNANLREYQKVGFSWLKTLDDYRLGGILADDMGLGKTIQLLAVIQSYKEEKNEKHFPSLVICPSSLTLNWQDEAGKFTPDLKTLVISGSQEDRREQIKSIGKYDIAIISYDLLKRDMEIFEDCNYTFRYLIADEAQYVKNNNTQNAKAIKKVNAITRYALTGTPIENSLAELWSIFDFIMPGYLFSYNKFKVNFETPIIKEDNKEKMNRLKEMLEPFILRRIKEKVLTELPDKTISVLNNEMDGEQLKLYLSYVQSAKKEAKEEIEANGIQNSQIKILALLMRLRQICCHPGLFINDYKGESKKLQQCMEIIQDAIEGGHKLLLFSGYSSMFPYIEDELKKLNINYLKLTGKTKVSERMDLVNEFNNNKDVKVFLISLKAGGTGLNLIGADMVIHYDPWWNISAENQATDRTYRIGQKRNVQVYKLITKNSIEEKIYNLQEKKAKLAEDILSTNQTFISKLSKDEIMDLFE